MNREFLKEFHERIGVNNDYFEGMPTFDGIIVGYMRRVDGQPFIFPFNVDDQIADKPVAGLSPNFVIPDTAPSWLRSLIRKQRNGHRYKANSI